MTDPEEQLRRVAEHRAFRVGAHEPDVAVSTDEPRRRMWWLAAAAVVVLVAGIFGVVWTVTGDEESGTVDQPDVEIADPPATTQPPTRPGPAVSEEPLDTRLCGLIMIDPGRPQPDPDAARDWADRIEGALDDVEPDVPATVVDDWAAASSGVRALIADLRAAGLDVSRLDLDDPRYARDEAAISRLSVWCEEQLLPPEPVDPTPPCEREDSWAVGDLDGDGLEDRLSPPDRRVLDEEQGLEATDTVICLGTGAEHPWTFTGRWVAASMQDFDRDGRDEVLLYDNFQPWFNSTVHVYVDDDHVELLPLLDETGEPFELVYTFDGLNDAPGYHTDGDRWFGCTDLVAPEGEDLVTGTFTHDLEAAVVTWELAPISWSGTTVSVGSPIRGSFPLSADRSLDADFVMPGTPARGFCKVEPSPCDLGAQLFGDVDGDGRDDVVAPEAARVCLANGVVADYGVDASNPEVWWLGDIEGDGRMELWLGGTSAYSVIASPWSVGADGSVRPVETATDCCQQYVTGAFAEGLADATWFSCADGAVVTGGYEISPTGNVSWTIDRPDGSEAYEASFDDPLATDAWIPGNGCQGTPWAGALEWTDWVLDAGSVGALNDWIAANESIVPAAFGPVRDALDVAESLRSANGPYRESAEEGWIEIHGLHDDSAGAIRFDIELSADGSRVEGIAQTWSCRPGRGHSDFTTEPCL